MARFYSNENFPFPAVEELRRLGHDVVTIQDTGRANRATSDADVLAFSCAENRVLLTLNRKRFIRLHEDHPDHTGIIVCTFDPDFVALARRVDAAIATQSEMSRRLIRVNRPQVS